MLATNHYFMTERVTAIQLQTVLILSADHIFQQPLVLLESL